jgi:hypothetical protein
MATKRDTLKKLSEYADRVNQYIKDQESQKINEENTIAKFISELLRILEWELLSPDVDYQHTIREVGRADITLKIKNVPVAIIEAKRFNEELSDQHMKQAMKYTTSARWRIITNGRDIKIYDKRYRQKWGRLFMKFPMGRFGEERFGEKYFNAIWLLSRNQINKLTAVADKIWEWEKLIREKTRIMKNKVVREFLISTLKEIKEGGAKPRFIELAIKEVRKRK